MSAEKVLIHYTVTEEEGKEPFVTYYSDLDETRTMELCQIEVNSDFINNSENLQLALVQLLLTPHIHNSLLLAILPFVEKMAPLVNLETQGSLNNWITQAKSVVNSSQ